jgi:hypothetical protein
VSGRLFSELVRHLFGPRFKAASLGGKIRLPRQIMHPHVLHLFAAFLNGFLDGLDLFIEPRRPLLQDASDAPLGGGIALVVERTSVVHQIDFARAQRFGQLTVD